MLPLFCGEQLAKRMTFTDKADFMRLLLWWYSVLEIFFPLSVIWTNYYLKFVSPERSLSVQKKTNINFEFLWIHVVGDFLHNSLLLTDHLI